VCTNKKGIDGFMNLIYGTNNPSKLKSMIKILDGLNLNVTGLESLNMGLEEAKETGKDPLSNATQKAMSYFEQVRQPIFSCDTGLYFEGVNEKDQPGVLIKRIHGNNLTNREMISYYSDLSSRYGGKLIAYYKNSICLVMDENNIFKYDGEDIYSEKFYIVDKPHKKYREGFPLDSLSVEIESMKYYYDLDGSKSETLGVICGFRNFFNRSLNVYLKTD
jgi:XTP/dITP diphosphohydrolase